jgi:hypothetical protein
VAQDLERDRRVLDERPFDPQEGGDTDDTEDEGDEDLVRRPGIGHAAPGEAEDGRG